MSAMDNVREAEPCIALPFFKTSYEVLITTDSPNVTNKALKETKKKKTLS
jgi:hypothetical protein